MQNAKAQQKNHRKIIIKLISKHPQIIDNAETFNLMSKKLRAKKNVISKTITKNILLCISII